MPNGRSGGKRRSRRLKQSNNEKGGRTVKTAPPFLRLWDLFLLPGASRLGGGLSLHSVAEMGGFVAVKEKQ